MKPRYFDLRPEEFLAAVSGEMSPAELGVYWMICLLQYTRGEDIEFDAEWFRAKFRPSKGNRVISDILDRLIATGRVYRDGPQIGVRRVREEVERATRRVRDASETGPRPARDRPETEDDKSNSNSLQGPLTNLTKQPTINKNKDASALRSEFAAWYAAFPRKVGKADAEKAYLKARRDASVEDLLSAIERYRLGKPAYADWSHPASWLNKKRWLDEYGDPAPNPDAPLIAPPSAAPPTPEELWPDLVETRH